mgnify:CR=1 FL=1
MIIISQDKKSFYNLDNVKSVDVLDNEIYITDDILSDEGTRIGEYATEERAKEVFNGIIRAYEKAGNLAFEINEDETEVRLIHNSNVFEMPEEWFYVKKTA